MNFWSRTGSETFDCCSEFRASDGAIVGRLTAVAVACGDVRDWKWGTMVAGITCQDVIGRQKR